MRFHLSVMKWFMEKATWGKAWLAFAFCQALYFLMVGVTIPAIESQADGMKVFDLMITGYSLEYARLFLEAMGEQGRHLYMTRQIPLDLVFPAVMAVTGAIFIALFARKKNARLGALMFIPICGALFDYLENAMVAVMLLSYPAAHSAVVKLSSIFTVLKFSFDALFIVVIVLMFVIYLYKMIREVPTNST